MSTIGTWFGDVRPSGAASFGTRRSPAASKTGATTASPPHPVIGRSVNATSRPFGPRQRQSLACIVLSLLLRHALCLQLDGTQRLLNDASVFSPSLLWFLR